MSTRILAIHYTPPGVIGGVEHVLQQHIELLTRRGYRVQIVAGRAGLSQIRTHVLPEIEIASPENARVEDELSEGVVGPGFHQRRQSILQKLSVLAADADFVIVHNALTLHFSLPLTAALWELARTRRPESIIAWCHDISWTNPLYIPLMHPGYPWELLRFPAPNVRYVTVSQERRQELSELWKDGSEAIDVVPNGIDVESFLRLSETSCEIVERYHLFDRDLVLLLPVRITRRKNIELAIRAVGSLKQRGLNVRFLISGPVAPHHPGRSDAYLQRLKDVRSDVGVEEEVVFLADELGKNLEDREIAQLYSLADVLLLPSASEGFGLPVLEAGLARLPAVVSDIPVFVEVGGGDVSRFDLSSDAESVAETVLEAVDTRAGRLHRRVVREFRWEVIVDRYLLPLLQH